MSPGSILSAGRREPIWPPLPRFDSGEDFYAFIYCLHGVDTEVIGFHRINDFFF